jgi:hypothetical protein
MLQVVAGWLSDRNGERRRKRHGFAVLPLRGLKIVYDVALFFRFRTVRLEEDLPQ